MDETERRCLFSALWHRKQGGLKVSSRETHLLSLHTPQLCRQRRWVSTHTHAHTRTHTHTHTQSCIPARKICKYKCAQPVSLIINYILKKEVSKMHMTIISVPPLLPHHRAPETWLFGLEPWVVRCMEHRCGMMWKAKQGIVGLWVLGIHYIRGDQGASLPFETWHPPHRPCTLSC